MFYRFVQQYRSVSVMILIRHVSGHTVIKYPDNTTDNGIKCTVIHTNWLEIDRYLTAILYTVSHTTVTRCK